MTHYKNKSVRIEDIHRGTGHRSHFIYAKLVDVHTGDMLIGATLDYIVSMLDRDLEPGPGYHE